MLLMPKPSPGPVLATLYFPMCYCLAEWFFQLPAQKEQIRYVCMYVQCTAMQYGRALPHRPKRCAKIHAFLELERNLRRFFAL